MSDSSTEYIHIATASYVCVSYSTLKYATDCWGSTATQYTVNIHCILSVYLYIDRFIVVYTMHVYVCICIYTAPLHAHTHTYTDIYADAGSALAKAYISNR